jgi:hypothetical protein
VSEWWQRVDRKSQLQEVRFLIPNGGCLVFVGDSRSGREQMAVLAEESFSYFGYTVHRVSESAGIPSLKGLLIEVWRRMTPTAPATQTPPWVAQAARLTPGGVVNQLIGIGEEQPEPRTAIILEGVDQAGPLPSHQAALLPELAARTGWPVVALSSEEAGTPWQSLGASVRLSTLPDFGADDVRDCLMGALELASRSVQDLEAGLQFAMSGGTGSLRPADAYMLLSSWGSE